MTKYAIITGTSSGIGRELCSRLLGDPETTWEVYGLCRHPENFYVDGQNPNPHYHPVVCDLTDRAQVTAAIKELRHSFTIDLLVNNAGVGFFGPHEELSPEKLHTMVAVNLEAPLILTQLLLRDLKQTLGTILNLSSVTARKADNTHGCAYGATKAALTSFGSSLFEEVRKYGVRVITLQPDMTESGFYENADFTTGEAEDTRLSAREVADLAMELISLRKGSLVTEVTLRPQLHRIQRKPRSERKD